MFAGGPVYEHRVDVKESGKSVSDFKNLASRFDGEWNHRFPEEKFASISKSELNKLKSTWSDGGKEGEVLVFHSSDCEWDLNAIAKDSRVTDLLDSTSILDLATPSLPTLFSMK